MLWGGCGGQSCRLDMLKNSTTHRRMLSRIKIEQLHQHCSAIILKRQSFGRDVRATQDSAKEFIHFNQTHANGGDISPRVAED